jgi:hypothetical protein
MCEINCQDDRGESIVTVNWRNASDLTFIHKIRNIPHDRRSIESIPFF